MLTYSQSSGQMHDASGTLLGTGYAGHSAGVNNPALQAILTPAPCRKESTPLIPRSTPPRTVLM
jgi:hypothetical protein